MPPLHVFIAREEMFQSINKHPERQVRINAAATSRPKEKLNWPGLTLGRGPGHMGGKHEVFWDR